MSFKDELSVSKIKTSEQREAALEVIQAVFQEEKGWVPDREKLLPVEDLERDDVSWFVVTRDKKALGVTRVLYTLPIDLYEEYGFQPVNPDLDVEAFIRNNRIAEVGRFAVLPEFRRKIHVAALLMKAASTETVEKGFTHFITDVFESDPNTPYGFHKRVLGFKVVATHDVGELKCQSRRITMLLDFKEAFNCMKRRNSWVFRFITEGWSDKLIQHLSA
ncbi:N-acetyltransferase domain-containing protein [Sulfidibacter corallicola]|uniref:N-acetyltransferase domain-containing protein n=1 Tax=Sulfidibacter corallicola TaxID=2818388 RepID=A0A8A4TQA0_SULCO|nr:GNAT family N-acetyltransferase [Sulfidibacter corallicola]QTD51262.1 hypothetical protein J3U87_02240 [Sulfidibacter corallicola]